jgi:enterochelin esterase-like enzyme
MGALLLLDHTFGETTMPGWNRFEEFLSEAQAASPDERQALVDTMLSERDAFPWIDENQATFIYGKGGAETVAVNLDRVKADPPFVAMERLEGTNLFHRTLTFEMDDLLDYMLAVDDPMTPLAQETDIPARVRRYWRMDPHNPAGMKTASADVSVLRMPHARPFPDWVNMKGVAKGNTVEHRIDSQELGVRGRKVWVHTPLGYAESSLSHPLLILQDGQWMVGPLQVPHIADALVKHGRMAPTVIAMVQSGTQADRIRDYVANPAYDAFLTNELIPFVQERYRVDGTSMAIGGASAGAIAAADVALRRPDVFNGLVLMSPPLGKGPKQAELAAYPEKFQSADLLPRRIFQAVGRYETKSRFLRPGLQLADILNERPDTEFRFVEYGSGHGLVAFRSILPEALSWIIPGWDSLKS